MKYVKLFENFVNEKLEVDKFKSICKEVSQANGFNFIESDKKLSAKTEDNINLIFGEPSKERAEKLKKPYLIISKYSDTQYYLIMTGAGEDKTDLLFQSYDRINKAWSEIGEKWDEFAPGTPNPFKIYGKLTSGRGIGTCTYNPETGKPTSQYNQEGYDKKSDNDIQINISTHFIDGNAKLNN